MQVACAKNSDNGSSSSTPIAKDENLNPAAPVPNSSNPISSPGQTNPPTKSVLNREDIGIIKSMFTPRLEAANSYLNQAQLLKSKLIAYDSEITLETCKELQEKISTNYRLMTYQYDNDKEIQSGVYICPKFINSKLEMDIFKNEYVNPKSFRLYKINVAQSQLGLPVAGGIVVEYQLSFHKDYPIKIVRQYLYDSKFKLVEYSVSKQEVKSDGAQEYFVEVGSMTEEGHTLGFSYKNWDNPSEGYLWKKSASFVSSNAFDIMANSYVQNDGSGNEVIANTYFLPDSQTWTDYEVSPLSRMGGTYKVNNENTTWLPKQLEYSYFTGAHKCEDGYQGYNNSGEYTRVFGEENCRQKLDIQQTNM